MNNEDTHGHGRWGVAWNRKLCFTFVKWSLGKTFVTCSSPVTKFAMTFGSWTFYFILFLPHYVLSTIGFVEGDMVMLVVSGCKSCQKTKANKCAKVKVPETEKQLLWFESAFRHSSSTVYLKQCSIFLWLFPLPFHLHNSVSCPAPLTPCLGFSFIRYWDWKLSCLYGDPELRSFWLGLWKIGLLQLNAGNAI